MRTDGAGLKVTNWCRTNRPGLPWFSATPAEATAPTEEPGSTAVVQGGRHGSFGAFVAHTELAKKATTKMMEAHEGQITKLNEERFDMKDAMKAMALANANMMAAITTKSDQTKVLTGRVDDIGQKTDQIGQKTDQIGQKTDRIIAALEKAGVAVSPDAAAPTTAPAATPAPPSGAPKPAQNPWMAATNSSGRGGGSKRKPGRGMGGTVSEDYDGLDDDDDEDMPPIIAARTRGSIARRVDAARLMLRGTGAPDGPEATGTDARESVLGAELSWPERIKLLYDAGDGTDERVAEVLNTIQRIEGELANAEITDMHF